jgi:hypothetical protein
LSYLKKKSQFIALPNYYIIGNGGYPFIYTGPKIPIDSSPSLKNAILDINSNPNYDYLVICLDADELSVEDRIAEFETYKQKFAKEGVVLNPKCQYKLIVQDKCIETWFLGNKKMYKRFPNNEPLISYSRFYNVSLNNPEEMGTYSDDFTCQDFHLQYLRVMLREKIKKSYKKENPLAIIDEPYINTIIDRAKDKKKHLKSLRSFVDFCEQIKNIM